MAMIVDQLCFGCMEERGQETVCPHCGWRADTPPASSLYLPPGTVLENQYVAGRVLGHGGFGVTYLGWDLRLARKVAIKEYLPSGVATRSGSLQITAHRDSVRNDYEYGLQRFLEEAQVLAKFQGFPNIIWVVQVFPANGSAYMVMEYLEGETFEAYLDRMGGRIPYAAAAIILMPVMDALREVHRRGILHRDISPDNIFIVRDGPVKLLDFGAARTAMGQRSMNLSVILKEGYAPEEQYVSNGRQGPFTDVYAMAGTMYRALTGTIPPPSIGRRRADELVPPTWLHSDIPATCETVLLRALSIDAKDRYQSIEDFQKALMQAEAGSPVLPPVPGPVPAPVPLIPPQPAPKPVTKRIALPALNTRWWPAFVAVGVALLAILATLIQPKPQPKAGAVIRSFAAQPSSIEAGGSASLSWSVDPHAMVTLENGIGTVPPNNGMSVSPKHTTQYVLKAQIGNEKPEFSTVLITVREAEAPPPQTSSVKIESFEPLPSAGAGSVGLSWATQGAKEVEISPNIGKVDPQGSVRFKLQRTTEFTLIARGEDGSETTRKVTVEVGSAPPPPPPPAPVAAPPVISFFRFDPPLIRPGQPVLLSWSVSGARSVTIQPGPGLVKSQGQVRLTPTADLSLTLQAVNASGASVSATASLRVEAPAQREPSRPVVTFTAEPSMIPPGQAAVLSWSLANAASATIEPGPISVQQASGQLRVQPQATTTYRITARSADGGITTAQATVRVVPAFAPQSPSIPSGGGAGANSAGLAVNVWHDHTGVVIRNQVMRGCFGVLTAGNGRLNFRVTQTSDGRRDDFSVPLSEIREASANRTPLLGRMAFHVRLQSGANFNFVPENGNAAQIASEINAARR